MRTLGMFLRSERGRSLSPRARDVLEELVLVAGAADSRRFADGRVVVACYVGVESLTERLGPNWSQRTVKRCLAELVAAGVVTRSRSYRMNSVTVVELPAPTPKRADANNVRRDTNGPASGATDGPTNTETTSVETTAAANRGTAAVCITSTKREPTTAATPGTALTDALTAAGIGEPARSKLAGELAAANIKPAHVAAIAKNAAEHGYGPGAVVVRLREHVAAIAKNTAAATATNDTAAAFLQVWRPLTNAERVAKREAFYTLNPTMRNQTACHVDDLPSFRRWVLAAAGRC